MSLSEQADRMLRECGEQEVLIYKGEGVPAIRALKFLRQVAALAEAAAGIEGHASVQDVVDEFEEAQW